MPVPGDTNRVVAAGPEGDTVTSWRQLAGQVPGGPTAVLAGGAGDALPAVRAHAERPAGDRGELLVAAASRVSEALQAELRADGFRVVRADGTDAPSVVRPAEPDRIWVLTSGTTGRPKRVPHTLDTLTTVTGAQPPRTWLCPYSPGTYAWWQLVTLSLSRPDQHLVLVSGSELDRWPALAAEHGVTAASGTPTFWRQALFTAGDELAAVPFEQLTLGGEPVDQAVLDRLRETFPAARVSWIYASSEAGAAIVVHDGRAGFPVVWLDRVRAGRPTLSVDGEELVIAPAGGEPVRTGDRVEVTGGRVHVVGRLGSDEINVGGAKISAGTVREVLQSHPGVGWARVSGRRAPIVGQMVVAEVVTDGSVDGPALTRWAAGRLPEYGVPRRVRVLSAIPVGDTLKSEV